MATDAARRPARSRAVGTLVGAGTVVDGGLTFAGRLRIDGTVTGLVCARPLAGSLLEIGPSGRVVGGASVESIVVAGMLGGEVCAEQRIEILPGARVDARIRYRDVQIHHGATVGGSLAAIDGDQNALKIAATRRGS